jgi:hypothetical protein
MAVKPSVFCTITNTTFSQLSTKYPALFNPVEINS